MRVRIMGKYWTFSREQTARSADGHACPETRKLVVRPKLSGQHELEVILHEALHAADWHKAEEWIEEAGEDLARLLWRLGYRKCEPRQRRERGRPHQRAKRRK